MTFGVLALVVVAGLVGPLLALPVGWRLPILLGELLAGIVLGRTLLDVVPVTDPTLSFLAEIGFALVMFVAGSRVPVSDPRLRRGLRAGAARAVAVGAAAAVLGIVVAAVF